MTCMQDIGSSSGPSHSLKSGGIGAGDWHQVGGGEAGFAFADPSDPDVVYAGTNRGPFRSADRGGRWERPAFDEGVEIWSILVHPQNPRVLYAGTSPVGIYRSEDGGDSWRKMADPGLPHDRVIMAFACRVMRLAVDPNSPDDIYATLEANGMMRSRNRGETWEDITADLIRATCLVGTADALVEQIRDLERQGLQELMFATGIDEKWAQAESFARSVLARF